MALWALLLRPGGAWRRSVTFAASQCNTCAFAAGRWVRVASVSHQAGPRSMQSGHEGLAIGVNSRSFLTCPVPPTFLAVSAPLALSPCVPRRALAERFADRDDQ